MRRLLVTKVADSAALSRRDALELVPRHVLDDAVADGALAAIFPGVYALPRFVADRAVRRKAALVYQPHSALSHLDGLDLWRYPVPAAALAEAPVHLTKGPGPHVCQPGLVVHNRQAFSRMQVYALGSHGLVVVEPEQAIVESWPLLPERDRRAPLIVALRDRRITAERLQSALRRQCNLAGVAEMRAMVGLVAGGCHSELELWGHAHVFHHPQLRRARLQHRVRFANRTVFLDRYLEEEMVDVELDGAAYHGLPGQRERDLRRDAALARLGILTVRYSHPRLHADPAGVQQELLDILRIRRRQLGIA